MNYTQSLVIKKAIMLVESLCFDIFVFKVMSVFYRQMPILTIHI
jgi:hypothetical protein